ncbi:hypothetical protein ACFPM1_12570 [Halorubrum rubrum]|uniref:Uncharacterized protein n=1 Tax=Halorubrum rubrum TaxID=1126240 RepID=A0ABD5R3Y8_9EURY|nr:hypothetical protein [Halorubrum rubrum]
MTRYPEKRSRRDGIESPDWLDDDEPYADVDVDRLPDWWRDVVREFEEHDLPPYRPPRFADGVLVPPLLERLEAEHGVEIQLMSIDVDHGDAWGLRVDGKVIAAVERERTADGRTRYGMTGEEFIDVVRERVEAVPDASDPNDRR